MSMGASDAAIAALFADLRLEIVGVVEKATVAATVLVLRRRCFFA